MHLDQPPWYRSAAAAIALAVCAGASAPPARAQAVVPPAPGYEPVAAALTRFIEDQMVEKGLPALSIALVDEAQIVWARGFGLVDPGDTIEATAETPYRVASVSKLFTDIAVMQLVERGELALDSPLTRYLPEFGPRNPFGAPVTLRQLLAHRSGLVREPPAGHYFDATSPSLAATVASLGGTSLVYAPGTRTKYSNAAIAAAGYVLERTGGRPFAAHVQRAVLEPLGMTSSSFDPPADLLRRRARGTMWTTDGRSFAAPTFPLGLGPASELTATMLDLGRFLSALFAGGQGARGRILQPSTLEAMWGVQFAGEGQRSGFGLGFAVSEIEGRARIGHSGWHYGFATEVAALPRERLGVAVSTTVDAANAVTERIADDALRLLLAVREGRALPEIETTEPLPPETMARLAGAYRSRTRAVDLAVRGGALWMQPVTGGFPVTLRARGDTLVSDGRLGYGERILQGRDLLVIGGDTLRRIPDREPAPAPARWLDLIGEYGWDHDVLYLLEREGRLYALIEWFALYPLTEVARDVFRFPDFGLYAGEELRVRRGSDGRVGAVQVAGPVFPRRSVGGEGAGRAGGAGGAATFRLAPLRPVEELRREALAALPPQPPAELRAPDLVDLATLDPLIRLDVRYATADNFMGAAMYSSARAFLQRPAAEALLRAHRRLAASGYGLLVHDAYRPWHVTRMFWDATPDSLRTFVADPARGSRHNRGAAVDLTLYELASGRPVRMPSGYDEFSPRAYAHYPGGTSLERWRRDLLRRAMEAEGFLANETEWWHFDFRDWGRYPVLNLPFERLGGGRPSRRQRGWRRAGGLRSTRPARAAVRPEGSMVTAPFTST